MKIKKTMMIAAQSPSTRDYYLAKAKEVLPDALIVTANDGSEAFTKIGNAPPSVLLMDWELPKLSGAQIAERLVKKTQFAKTNIILVSLLPSKEHFIDEIITGRVQFLENAHDNEEFSRVIKKAMALSTGQEPPAEFLLTKLTANQIFFNEGDPAKAVYIVKSGQLKAFKKVDGKEVTLGLINPGEFVGEMAYLNGQPRSASVQAILDSELIEVPMGTFEKVLQQRPAWSKALMVTLSKRVSTSNQEKPERKPA